MLSVVFIFIIFIPLINYLFLSKINILSIFYMLIPFAFFQYVTPLMITTLHLQYEVLQILYITLFCCYLLGLSLFIGLYTKKTSNANVFTYQNFISALKKWSPCAIGAGMFIVIAIFTYSYFPDTEAYITASYQWMYNNDLSFDGIDTINTQYTSVGMITLFPSLFGIQTPAAYNLLNPFLMTYIMITILNEFVWKTFINISLSWKLYLVNIIMLFCIGLASAFCISFMTSGNIFNQSMILVVVIATIMFNKQQSWTMGVSLLFFSLLSSTGIVNGFCIVVALILIQAIFMNWRIVFKTLSLASFSLFLPILLIADSALAHWIVYIATLIIAIVYCLIARIGNKWVVWDMNLFMFVRKYEAHLVISFTILNSIVCFLIVLLFGFLYKEKALYTNYLVFGNLIFNVIFIIMAWFTWKKRKMIDQNGWFFLFTSICSLFILIIIMITDNNNQSLWRIIYLNPGMGGAIDLVVLWLLLLLIYIENIKLESIQIFKYKINISGLGKIYTRLVTPIFSLSLLGVASGFGTYNVLSPNIKLFRFTDNVYTNINKVSQSDANLLKDLTGTVVTDVQLFYLLTNCQNITNNIFNNNFYPNTANNSNWTMSAYGFSSTISLSNPQIPKQQIIDELSVHLASLDFSIYKNLILNKHSDYFELTLKYLQTDKNLNIVYGNNIVLVQ